MTQTDAADRLLDDLVQPFQIDAFRLRGRLVRLGGALRRVLAGHGYPPPVRGLLGEAMALSAALAAMMKYDGLFTVQIQSDGPVSLIVTDITSDGDIRGYGRYDPDRVDAARQAKGEAVGRYLGSGLLAFTVDQGPDTNRYQGITELAGGTLADCAHAYFRQSEQLQTAIKLAASEDAEAPGAAALMLQRLPEDIRPGANMEQAEEEWREAVILLSSITDAELLDPALSPADVLYRLYHQEGVRVFAPRPLRHRCRCSRRKVERTLASFPRDEVEDLKEDGKVVVTCEFCKAVYEFDDAALAAIYAP
jgi:molecular chaperone Hsp33